MFWEWVKSKIEDHPGEIIVGCGTWWLLSVFGALFYYAEYFKSENRIAQWTVVPMAVNTIIVIALTAFLIIALIYAFIRDTIVDYREFKLTYEKPKRKHEYDPHDATGGDIADAP